METVSCKNVVVPAILKCGIKFDANGFLAAPLKAASGIDLDTDSAFAPISGIKPNLESRRVTLSWDAVLAPTDSGMAPVSEIKPTLGKRSKASQEGVTPSEDAVSADRAASKETESERHGAVDSSSSSNTGGYAIEC